METLKVKLGAQLFLNFDFRGVDLIDKVAQFIQNVGDMLSDVYTLIYTEGKLENYNTRLSELEELLYSAIDDLVLASTSGSAKNLSNAWLKAHQVLRDLKAIIALENLAKLDHEAIRLDEWINSFIKSRASRRFGYGED